MTQSVPKRRTAAALLAAAALALSGLVLSQTTASAALPTANLLLPTENAQANPYTGTITVEADAQDTAEANYPAGVRVAEAWLYAEDVLGSPTTFVGQNPNNHESKFFMGYLTRVSGTDVNGKWRLQWQVPTTGYYDATRDGDHTNPVPEGQTRRYTMPTGYYGIQTHWIDDSWLASPGAPGFSQKNRVYIDTGTAAPPAPPVNIAVQNPGLETWLGAEPDCWNYSGWGNGNAVFTKVAGHTGTNGAQITLTNRTTGDYKLMQSDACGLAVTPGKKYDVSAWYKSTTAAATLTAFTRNAANGQWNYWTDLPNVAVNANWAQITATTPAVPAGVDRIKWGIALPANGTLVTDDYTFAENGGGTPSVDPPVDPPVTPPTGDNLVANPSMETGAPDCYTLGGWGTITATGASVADAHTGTKGYRINITARTSGDRKLMISETAACGVKVTAGKRYDVSTWYKSNIPVGLTAFRHTAAGWTYWTELNNGGPSAAWTKIAALTPNVPAGTDMIVFGISVASVGFVVLDDYSAVDPATTPPPPSQDANGRWDVATYSLNVRAAHAVLLHTGKILLIAGSGNDENLFKAGTFKSVLLDPETGQQTDIPTPADMFCGGHVQLPDGKVLVMSGTAGYPTAQNGNYLGAKFNYYFDPADNSYHRLGDTRHGHWYPSTIELGNGDVLGVGGLKENGDGNVEVEYFKTATRTWDNSAVPQTWKYFGMYPAMTLMSDGRLFYSGSHTFGNGTPGTGSFIYNWKTGTVTDTPGLRDKDMRDQSASVLLYPAQDQKVAIIGGGNVDGADPAHNHTDVIDLKQAAPSYVPGPDLPFPAMYQTAVIMPTGGIFVTNRGLYNRTDATNMAAMSDAGMTHWDNVAADPIARNYHSTALLLPSGKVIAIGSNPQTNTWEFRVSIYTPSYVTNANRPTITAAPATAGYGGTINITGSAPISEALLIKPMAVTHSTDPNQRAVKLPITVTNGNTVTVSTPANGNIAPPGWYMLWIKNAAGTPSAAKWIRIS